MNVCATLGRVIQRQSLKGNLPLSVPKLPKIEKSLTATGNVFLKSYGALRTFMQNNPILPNSFNL